MVVIILFHHLIQLINLIQIIDGRPLIKPWNIKDCIANKWFATFKGSCYHYNNNSGSSILNDIQIETGCQYCVYRGFQSKEKIIFDYGYPECIKDVSDNGLHKQCFNNRQDSNEEILCCCDHYLCNNLFQILPIPLPPPKITNVILEISSGLRKVLRTDPDSDHGFNISDECKPQTYNKSCYNYNYYGGALSLTDVTMMSGCTFCAYEMHYKPPQYELPLYGYPICVKQNSYYNILNFNDHCFRKRPPTSSYEAMVFFCCCVSICNNDFDVEGLELPAPYTTTSTTSSTTKGPTPTPIPSNVFPNANHGYNISSECDAKLFNKTCYNLDYYNNYNIGDEPQAMNNCLFCVYLVNYRPPQYQRHLNGYPICISSSNEYIGIKNLNDRCVDASVSVSNFNPYEFFCCCQTLCNNIWKHAPYPFPPPPPKSSTSTVMTEAPNETTTTTTTEVPTRSDLQFDCYGLSFNKSIVVYSNCTGCIKTKVYNIEEKPFLSCLRPHLDPFDNFQQFCNEYFLDRKVLIYVYCCYTNLCNDINVCTNIIGSAMVIYCLSVIVGFINIM